MRRTAPALAAAALLGACTVEVDGAPCTAPGTAFECPGGQACGNNGRCSARALACAASRCTPVADDVCLDEGGAASGTAVARRCVDLDPVCGAWVEEPCAARGLLCGGRPAAARCECPANPTAELVVHPGGGGSGDPRPTGLRAPVACAFGTLTGALARARELRAVDPETVVTVTLEGADPGAAASFSGASGERFPLVIPGGVVVASDAATRGGSYEILLDAASAGSAVVELEAASALSGVTVRNVAGAAGIGLDATCAGSGAVISVSHVAIEARSASGAQLDVGLRGSGPCSVRADALEVRGASAEGILWAPPRSTDALELRGAVVAGNGAGVVATGGAAWLDSVRVERNAGRGIDVGAAELTLIGSKIVRNGDTGLVLGVASPGHRVLGSTVWANGATTAWVGGLSGTARRAGGIVLAAWQSRQGIADLELNRIYANAGDQLLLVGPASTSWWSLGASERASSCSSPNVLGCYDAAPDPVPYRGIVAVDVDVAQYWQLWDPNGPREYVARLPSGTVFTGASCDWVGPPLDCGSEDPPPQ